jgi:GTP-binding protein
MSGAKVAPKGGEAKAAPKKAAPKGTRIVDARFVAGAAPGSSLPPPVHVEVAFAGRSNVGKSSLINTLLERKNLVRTSSTPGSTRQVNLYEAKAGDGTLFHLVDLPGYGFTHRSKREQGAWKELIEGYLAGRATLAAVVLLVDVRRGLEPDDLELVEFVQSINHPSRRPLGLVIVATKLDKVARAARRPALDALRKAMPPAVVEGGRLRLQGFSSETGEGREELWSVLRALGLGAPQA